MQTNIQNMYNAVKSVADWWDQYKIDHDEVKRKYAPIPLMQWEQNKKFEATQVVNNALSKITPNEKELLNLIEQSHIVKSSQVNGDVTLLTIPNLKLSIADLTAILERNKDNSVITKLAGDYMSRNRKDFVGYDILRYENLSITEQKQKDAAKRIANDARFAIGKKVEEGDLIYGTVVANFRDKWNTIFADQMAVIGNP
jgi:hypothetical protein